MKDFDLELVKKGYPFQTKDGRPARLICDNRVGKGSDGPRYYFDYVNNTIKYFN